MNTHPAGKVHFHGKDTHILRTGQFRIKLGECWRDHFVKGIWMGCNEGKDGEVIKKRV